MRRDYESRRDMAMRRREMRDMARRGMRMRDGRNPYGSKGGYVTSGRDRMEDMPRRDYDYEENRGYEDMNGFPFEVRGNFDMRDLARRRNSRGQYMSDREMDGHYQMPYMMDFANSMKLSKEELKEWIEDMTDELEPQYKHLYTKENVEQVANQMQIDFDKFSPLELLASTLIMATDYAKSVGQADINRNVAMGKEFLCDKDASVRYGEKLATYYDSIVVG